MHCFQLAIPFFLSFATVGVNGDKLGVGGGDVLLAISNGCPFQLGDIVACLLGRDIHNIRGPETIPIRERLKGVRIEVGVERYMVRPFVGSQRGKFPSFPPESCLKLKAIGSGMNGESSPRFFSKMKPFVQHKLVPPPRPPVMAPTTPTWITGPTLVARPPSPSHHNLTGLC